jgi:hypothetical protein
MNIESMSRFACVGLAGLLFAPMAARAELDYAIELGGGYSDNIERVPTNESDEKIGTFGVDLMWERQTRRLESEVLVDLTYLEYFDESYDSEVVGIADAELTFGILPERLTWLFQDSFGQAQPDPFRPVTPDNRENINYFTTGPDLLLRLGNTGVLNFFGRYSSTNYEESLLDADRTAFGFTIGRNLGGRSQIALNVVSAATDFEEPTLTDYDRENAFLSYDVQVARTDLRLELGYSWLERDVGGKTDGLLANLSIAREVSSYSTVYLELGSQFTDASDSLRGAIEGRAPGGPDITATSDPFENRQAEARWEFQRNRTGFTLGAAWGQDRYEEQTAIDRTRLAYEANFTRRMTPAIAFSLGAFLNDEEFDNVDLQSDELTVSARLSWRVGRTVTLALLGERVERDTSDGSNEFVENRYFLTVGYRPGGTSGSFRAP